METKKKITSEPKEVFQCACDVNDYMKILPHHKGISFKNSMIVTSSKEFDKKYETHIVLKVSDIQKLHKILDDYLIDKLLGV